MQKDSGTSGWPGVSINKMSYWMGTSNYYHNDWKYQSCLPWNNKYFKVVPIVQDWKSPFIPCVIISTQKQNEVPVLGCPKRTRIAFPRAVVEKWQLWTTIAQQHMMDLLHSEAKKCYQADTGTISFGVLKQEELKEKAYQYLPAPACSHSLANFFGKNRRQPFQEDLHQ